MSVAFPVLLVDDEPEIADVLQQAAKLEFPEAQLAHIRYPDQVLPYLNDTVNSAPRLILLDVDLGSTQTGIDLIAQLRLHPLGHLVPIVMLSSNSDKEIVIASYKEGANAYNVKPYTYREWKEYVAALRAYWLNQIEPTGSL